MKSKKYAMGLMQRRCKLGWKYTILFPLHFLLPQRNNRTCIGKGESDDKIGEDEDR